MLLAAGCGGGGGGGDSVPAAVVAGARPIGAERRFHPPPPNRRVPGCTRQLGKRLPAHVEVFAEDRVVVLPMGIGTEPPRAQALGRITAARCYGDVVTLDPTGIALVRAGKRARVGDLFRLWGLPLDRRRLAGFSGGPVRVYVGGRELRVDPREVPLAPRSEIVLEIGPYVPPHRTFAFPPGH